MPTDITAAAAVQVSAVGTGLPANGGYWNAETAPPAWIEFTWQQLVTIDQVVLTVEQSPNGNASHRIVATLANGLEESETLNGVTANGQVLTTTVSFQPTNVHRLRIETLVSPSWVAWQRLQIIGDFQAQPSPPDITASAAVTTTPTGVGSPSNGGYWNAKAGPETSVLFTWPNPVNIGQVSLIVVQSPSGPTYHEIVATLGDGTTQIYADLHLNTWSGDLLRIPRVLANVRMLNVKTLISPSWVAWRAIQINGA
jgi:hypothetical protein